MAASSAQTADRPTPSTIGLWEGGRVHNRAAWQTPGMAALANRVATLDDLEAVTETLTLAFATDPVWGPYSYPDLEQARQVWRMAARIELRWGASYVTPNCESVAVWI